MENRSNYFKFEYFVAQAVELIKSPHGHKPPNVLVFAPGSLESLYILYEKVQKNRNKSFLLHIFVYILMCNLQVYI